MTNENKVVVAVKGIIFNKGKVLIVKRTDYDDVGGGTWECPGGKIDFGEDLVAALVREVKEEVGLDITVEKILYATTFNTDPMRQVVILTYLCRSVENEITLSDEHVDFLWATKEQLRQSLLASIVEDFEKNDIFSINELL